MRVLFDHNVPRSLRTYLRPHLVMTAAQLQWSTRSNGDLLRAGEADGFDVFIPGDQNVVYQQNNANRKIALIVISRTYRASVMASGQAIAGALERVVPRGFEFLKIEQVRRGGV